MGLLVLAAAAVASFLSQYLYPLRYNELLAVFYTSGQQAWLFYLLTARNLLLVGLLGLIIGQLKAGARTAASPVSH